MNSLQNIRSYDRMQVSFHKVKKPLIVDIADQSSIGLKSIDEIFFLNADRVKLISIEVIEAAMDEQVLHLHCAAGVG